MPPRGRILHIEIPANLSDESAAQILEFLYELTRAFDSRYFDQIHRYYDNLRTDMMNSRCADSAPTPDPNSPPIDPF